MLVIVREFRLQAVFFVLVLAIVIDAIEPSSSNHGNGLRLESESQSQSAAHQEAEGENGSEK